MSEYAQSDMPEFTLGRGEIKLPSLYDESWEPDIPEFFGRVWMLNEGQPLGLVDGKELLVPPDASQPLVCIRHTYQERSSAAINAERNRQQYIRQAVTVGTGRHEILQAEGTAWNPWLTYTYGSQAGGPLASGPHHKITWQGRPVAWHDVKNKTPFKENETHTAYWERVDLLYREQIRNILEKTVKLLSPES